MSTFVAIIETQLIKPVVLWNVDASQLIKSSRIVQPLSDQHRRYWIGIASDPIDARNSMARVYPFAPFHVAHAIRSDNRSEMLNEALRMKLQDKHAAHSWYELSPDDLIWLRSITTDNYAQMIPQIENDLAALNGVEVQDVTRRKAGPKRDRAPEPTMSVEEVEALRQRLLEQANAELY